MKASLERKKTIGKQPPGRLLTTERIVTYGLAVLLFVVEFLIIATKNPGRRVECFLVAFPLVLFFQVIFSLRLVGRFHRIYERLERLEQALNGPRSSSASSNPNPHS